jgi:hypothetical protein
MFARIDDAQVARFAAEVAKLPQDSKGLDFYHAYDGKSHDAEMYPELDHPKAIDYFFFVCLHQHGFWHGDRRGYRAPMFATFDGKRVKGSDALWRSLMRALRTAPDIFHPLCLASLKEDELTELLFVHDEGPLPLPDPATRLELSRTYGNWFMRNLRKNVTPASLVETANRAAKPLSAFLSAIAQVPGFDKDPLQKKSRLLALTLMNRPEAFLKPAPGEQLGPIVDYHLMRVALRMGLVRLAGLQVERNADRKWCRPVVEQAIRQAVHDALAQVQALSGVSSATLDYAMWSARKFCPEMSEPECGKCAFRDACAMNKGLFQPVLRTTAY